MRERALMFSDLVKRNRTCRRFAEDARIPADLLRDWVDCARMTASSANRQPLKYAIVTEPSACDQMFPLCKWAAALPDWNGPEPGERPSAYLIMLVDKELSINEVFTARDEGIAAQTIMLAAREAGYGGCIIAAFAHAECLRVLNLDAERFEPALVLALGEPVEQARIIALPHDGSTAYHRDGEQVNCVPKRALDDLIIANR